MNLIQSKLMYLIALFSVLMFVACTDEEVGEVMALATDEAATIVEASMVTNTGGFTKSIDDLIENLEEIDLDSACDSTFADSNQYKYSGQFVQAAYTANWILDLTCNSFNIPMSADYEASSVAQYTTQRVSSDDNTSLEGSLTGIQLSSDAFMLNGAYTREGTQTLSVRETKNISSVLAIQLLELRIGKSSQNIESGSGTFSLTGTAPSGSFSHTGSITFKGNKTATLEINGESFEIDWN